MPTAATATSTGSIAGLEETGAASAGSRVRAAPAAARGGGARRCPTGASTSTTTTTATLTSRRCQMRAITDWYFTAHPPIMHDLHESLPLLYTYSGGPPQNPNLDPILFAELPFFANWELSQMTKWGMPGVYTHAFMDGWSPGYLGSVAYNHNGMMKMYETQSGRDCAGTASPAPPADRRRRRMLRRGGWRGGRGGDGGGRRRGRWRRAARRRARSGAPTRRPRRRRRGRAGARAGRAGAAPGGGRAAVPTGRGGGQPREWYRGIPVPPNAVANFTRRNNTNYMQTGVLSALQLTSMFPNLVLENFYMKTKNSIDAGRTSAPHGVRHSGAARHDAGRPSSSTSCARRASRSARQRAEFKIDDVTYRRRLLRRSSRSAVLAPGEEPAREAGLSRSGAAHLRRQRLDDGPRVQRRREGDPRQGDPRRARRRWSRRPTLQRHGRPARARPASPSRTSARTT